MVADKGKNMKLAEKGEEDKSEQINEDFIFPSRSFKISKTSSRRKLDSLDYSLPCVKCLPHLDKINEEASEKVLEVEQKYNEIRKPIYDKRNEKIKSISDFWLTAFLSHPTLGELLNEEDQKIFKYISSLEVEDFKDLKSGYSITTSIPIHTLKILTKTFTFLDEGTKIIATKIKWKEGMQKDDMDEIHDEVAEIIKEDLWPNPLAYFNTVTSPDDFDGDEEGDGTNCVFSVTVLTIRDLVVSDFGFDGLPG
ncbi:NAP1-related protein 1 [Hibiscus syriacus]|uniref:NAP1-related protein 1 n=1 Tax=Hibiscus syriacus TaxID=106335 RepID=A0A6A3CU72_HIBSY|nr:NAP1-related protein 1 [Hibiscus syriacus]